MNQQVSPKRLRPDLNVPNVISIARIILAGIVFWFMLQGAYLTAGIIFVAAAATDWLDGFLARRLKQTSLFGSLIDMTADELLFMPTLIIAVGAGLFIRAESMMPLNPYLYAVPALLGGVFVFAGIGSYLWKRRSQNIEFPTPTRIAKINFWFWLAPLILAIFNIGPDWLLAVMMYLAIISTILTFYSYLKKAGYVFTK